MKTFKCFILFLSIAALLLITAESAAAVRDAKQLSSEVFRLHVIADSDSNDEQELKLKVRDAILKETAEIFKEAKNATQAAEIAGKNLLLIEEIAKKTVAENGYSHDVKVSVRDSFFPTKSYENEVTLPAGVYSSLRVEIGSASGQNWWCVLFPQICLSTSLSESSVKKEMLSDSSRELATGSKKGARVKFKIVEIINGLFGR